MKKWNGPFGLKKKNKVRIFCDLDAFINAFH